MKGKESRKESKKEKKVATIGKVQSDYQKDKTSKSIPTPLVNKRPLK